MDYLRLFAERKQKGPTALIGPNQVRHAQEDAIPILDTKCSITEFHTNAEAREIAAQANNYIKALIEKKASLVELSATHCLSLCKDKPNDILTFAFIRDDGKRSIYGIETEKDNGYVFLQVIIPGVTLPNKALFTVHPYSSKVVIPFLSHIKEQIKIHAPFVLQDRNGLK